MCSRVEITKWVPSIINIRSIYDDDFKAISTLSYQKVCLILTTRLIRNIESLCLFSSRHFVLWYEKKTELWTFRLERALYNTLPDYMRPYTTERDGEYGILIIFNIHSQPRNFEISDLVIVIVMGKEALEITKLLTSRGSYPSTGQLRNNKNKNKSIIILFFT